MSASGARPCRSRPVLCASTRRWSNGADGILQKLRFDYLPPQLDTLCEQASKRELNYREFLTEALAAEWAGRHQKGLERAGSTKRTWRGTKTPAQLDFSFQHSIDRRVIR
jgi:DNA replication protein DnaC